MYSGPTGHVRKEEEGSTVIGDPPTIQRSGNAEIIQQRQRQDKNTLQTRRKRIKYI
jgi:hypothetical protein